MIKCSTWISPLLFIFIKILDIISIMKNINLLVNFEPLEIRCFKTVVLSKFLWVQQLARGL